MSILGIVVGLFVLVLAHEPSVQLGGILLIAISLALISWFEIEVRRLDDGRRGKSGE